MSDDAKKATHLEPNDLLSLVRLGKINAELRALDMAAAPLRKRAADLGKALAEKYGLDPMAGDGADDETGEIRRAPKPAALKAVGE